MAKIASSSSRLSRFSHSSAKPPPLNAPPKREIAQFECAQRAKMVLGFTAIGKTHLAAKANREFEWLHVIDYSLTTHEVEFTP